MKKVLVFTFVLLFVFAVYSESPAQPRGGNYKSSNRGYVQRGVHRGDIHHVRSGFYSTWPGYRGIYRGRYYGYYGPRYIPYPYYYASWNNCGYWGFDPYGGRVWIVVPCY